MSETRKMDAMRLAVFASHPVQYYAPLYRQLAREIDIHVFFAHRPTPAQQAVGFGVPFAWDVDVLSGFEHSFVRNVARHPGVDHFFGADTPDIHNLLRAGRFDAALAIGWGTKALVQGAVAARQLGLPVLVRGDSQLETPRSRLKKAVKALVYPPFLRLFSAALYVGARSRAYYEAYRFPQERLFFSPHCVDNEWFAARATAQARAQLRAECDISDQTKVALFAGKMVPFKRPLDLIEAAALLNAQGARIEIMTAGAGELDMQMGADAQARGVRLHRLGFCNQTRMPAVYAAADVLALPSIGRETWGLVANEALACGRPIVVSDACGCAPDLAADGAAGAIFAAGDAQGLADALRHVLDAPPSSDAIARKSAAYSLAAAAAGVHAALTHVVRHA